MPLALPRSALIVSLTVVCLAPTSSWALQPLSFFVESSRSHNVDLQEVAAALDAQRAQVDLTLGRALPNVSARGVYTRNQYQVPFGPIPGLLPVQVFIQRYDQLDAIFTLSVPLVDLGSFERIRASSTGADSAQKQLEATSLAVESAVASTYFNLVGSQALVAAAERALEVQRTSLAQSEERYRSGKGAVLEVDRANAQVEAQNQQVIQAKLLVALAARALQTVSGAAPDLAQPASLDDDLHEEQAMDRFLLPEEQVPAVAAAAIARVSAEQSASSSRLALIPSLAGSFGEHGTNATSFIGHAWSYTAVVSLQWQLDYTSFAAIRAQDAAAAAAKARAERARLNWQDSVHRSWTTVGAAIARSRSARAQQAAATHASQLASDRYEAGAATQLDVLQAQRDAFAADVARVQADADLANARLQLRLSAGLDPFAPSSSAHGAP